MTGLRVESVRQSYGRQEILEDINLMLESGQILALLGASGCGKTTLLRVIAGFERPAAGEIFLNERPLDASGSYLPAEQRRIGFVPQEGTLFPHLTVAGNVAFGLSRAERRSGRVADVLRLAKLDSLGRRYPHQISGGQQQRVALARALAPRPDLILLDEPFNALDLALRRNIAAEVISMLRAEATTAILVTHDPLEAFASADLIAVMEAGRILQCAPAATVYWCPASLQAARLTGATVELAGVARGHHADTVLGQVPLMAGGVTTGNVVIVLRPEQVVSTQAGQGILAQQIGSAFRGDHTLVTVAVGGTELLLRLHNVITDDCGSLSLRVIGTAVAFPTQVI